jgi:hypothetical protein
MIEASIAKKAGDPVEEDVIGNEQDEKRRAFVNQKILHAALHATYIGWDPKGHYRIKEKAPFLLSSRQRWRSDVLTALAGLKATSSKLKETYLLY